MSALTEAAKSLVNRHVALGPKFSEIENVATEAGLDPSDLAAEVVKLLDTIEPVA